jgi:hypothetical protein
MVSFACAFFDVFVGVGASPSEADIADVSDDESSEAEVVILVLLNSQLWKWSASGFSSSKIFCSALDKL